MSLQKVVNVFKKELLDKLKHDKITLFISKDGSFGVSYPDDPLVYSLVTHLFLLDRESLSLITKHFKIINVKEGYVIILSKTEIPVNENGIKSVCSNLDFTSIDKIIKLLKIIFENS